VDLFLDLLVAAYSFCAVGFFSAVFVFHYGLPQLGRAGFLCAVVLFGSLPVIRFGLRSGWWGGNVQTVYQSQAITREYAGKFAKVRQSREKEIDDLKAKVPSGGCLGPPLSRSDAKKIFTLRNYIRDDADVVSQIEALLPSFWSPLLPHRQIAFPVASVKDDDKDEANEAKGKTVTARKSRSKAKGREKSKSKTTGKAKRKDETKSQWKGRTSYLDPDDHVYSVPLKNFSYWEWFLYYFEHLFSSLWGLLTGCVFVWVCKPVWIQAWRDRRLRHQKKKNHETWLREEVDRKKREKTYRLSQGKPDVPTCEETEETILPLPPPPPIPKKTAQQKRKERRAIKKVEVEQTPERDVDDYEDQAHDWDDAETPV